MLPFRFLILEVPTDVQASLLSFVGQEAIAHAAAIFATLTAAFTFAEVQKREKLEGNRTTFCALILSILLAGSIYAGLRLYYYGLLSGIILGYPGVPNQTLNQYWGNVTLGMAHGGPSTNFFFVYLGAGATIQSLSISYVLGFLMAVGVTSYSIGNQGWWDTFHLLPSWFRFMLYWAVFDYFLEITLVPGLIYVVGNLNAAVIALLLAALRSLILTRLDRKLFALLRWLIFRHLFVTVRPPVAASHPGS